MSRFLIPNKRRIGDEVITPTGARAIVLEVRSFHEAMAIMSEEEVELTGRDLMARLGPNAPATWQQVLVRQRGYLKWYPNTELKEAEADCD